MFAPAFVSVKDKAGVVVVVASVVVNNGDKSPAEKFVTVPLPPEEGRTPESCFTQTAPSK